MADAATSVRIQSDPSRVNVKMASLWPRIRDLALVRMLCLLCPNLDYLDLGLGE